MAQRSPDHHEGSEVGEADVHLDVLDGGVDDEAGEGEDESGHDEREADAQQVGAESKDEEHGCAADVGGDGVEVRLEDVVAEAGDDLRHEEAYRLEGHAEADFDEVGVGRGVVEDLEGVADVELFRHDGRGVHLDAAEGEGFLVGGEEAGGGGVAREVPECEEGEEQRCGTFDEEEVAPFVED